MPNKNKFINKECV